jgi:hypothetical protein
MLIIHECISRFLCEIVILVHGHEQDKVFVTFLTGSWELSVACLGALVTRWSALFCWTFVFWRNLFGFQTL